ncbi:MAG TPA: CHAT domain-containing protein, partial [Kofleriaceae bacterium]
ALAGLPADSDILPRRPELLDLIGIGRTGRKLVVHPDPPLTDGEATVLRTAHPAVRLATPTTLLGRVLLAQDPKPPLSGTTLAFSLSSGEGLPRLEDGQIGDGLTEDHVEDVVYSIVLATLRSGARIAYGGDFRSGPSYTRFLVDLHRLYGGLGSRGSAQLICFLDRGARDGVDPDGIEFHPIDVPAPSGSERFPDLRSQLWHLAMREEMCRRCAGRILLGGKTRPAKPCECLGDANPPAGFRGVWPGLLEEAWRTLRLDRALYVLGGFGGAAGLIADMLTTGTVPEEFTRSHHAGSPLAELLGRFDMARGSLAKAGASAEVLLETTPGRYADVEDLARMVLARWQQFAAGDATAWRNGLDLDENRRLFCSTDRTEITHLVFEGLRRLQRGADGELQIALYHGDIASVPKVDGYAVTVTPGIPSIGAYAALVPHVERARPGAPESTSSVSLQAVATSDLSGSHVLLAQLTLPPIGQSIELAGVEQIAHDIAFEANRVGLESIACPVFATSFGLSIADSARAMVEGVRRGRGHHPAKLVFCEVDGNRYEQLRTALGSDAVELRSGAPAPPPTSGPLLHVDVEPRPGDGLGAKVTLYVPDASQPVAPMHEVEIAPELWERLRRRMVNFDETIEIGRLLWRELLSDKIREVLVRYASRPLVVLGDEVASSIPWELLIEDRDGAGPRSGGVVRRIALSGSYRSPIDQLERARLRVLVVADPRRNLDHAMPEADDVCAALGGRADVIVRRLDREQATVAAVTEQLATGYHDVFHYAGHDYFDDEQPDRGGLVLADGVLAAADLPPRAPQLVFLSACESGRVRDGHAATRDVVLSSSPGRVFHSRGRSLAEAFLRAGVRSFVGTFYTVEDASARAFAAAVHGELAAGRTLGTAMRTARCALHGNRRPDWGNFLLYGDDGLVL